MYKRFRAVPALIFLFAIAAQAQSTVKFQGNIRTRVESWDWFEGQANNSYLFSGSALRFGAVQTGKRFDWQIDLVAPILLGLPDDAVAPGTQGALGLGGNYFTGNDRSRNAAMIFPKQAFVRWKGESASLRAGRFEFSDGAETVPAEPTLAWLKRERIAQRLIGPFGWTHVGRSFDGMHFAWNRPGTNVTFVGALPTRGVFQTDGWGNLSAGFGYGALTRSYSGKTHSSDVRVFGIYYQDWRDVLKTDNRPLAARQGEFRNVRIGSFGGHWLHRAGPFDVTVWGVAQTGKWGSLDHRAEAWFTEAGWQPAVLPKLRPWLRGGYSWSSGDSDPLDGQHGTFFQVLPTPRPYARMPFFNMMNNQDIMGMLILRPGKALTLRAEVHGLRLTNRNDLWYQGGGAFQPWSFGYIGRATNGARGLATLFDIGADYIVNASTTVSGYFAHARGHAVMRAIYPDGKNGNFGYLELTHRF